MSQNELDTLKQQNANLNDQINRTNAGVNNLFAQLEAHRAELNDSRAISLQLRTQIVILQKSNNELQEKLKSLETPKPSVDAVTKQGK